MRLSGYLTVLSAVGVTAIVSLVGSHADAQSGYALSFADDGNIYLDGHVFGHVDPLNMPTTGIRSMFPGMDAIHRGNIFLHGSVNTRSTSFPGVILHSNQSGPTASLTSTGDLYIGGTIQNNLGCSNTKWEPERWGTNPNVGTIPVPSGSLQDRIQFANFCYNYASNRQDPEYTGDGPDRDFLALDPPLTFPGNGYECPNGGHLAFYANNPSGPVHWWRLDQEQGTWSSKDAWNPPTNVDSVHHLNPIANPLDDLGGHPGLNPVGFYCVCGRQAPGLSVLKKVMTDAPMHFQLKIVNLSINDVHLNTLKLQYLFTDESNVQGSPQGSPVVLSSNTATYPPDASGSGTDYSALTTMTVQPGANGTPVNSILEILVNSPAVLAVGSSLNLEVRYNAPSGTVLDQSNDWSNVNCQPGYHTFVDSDLPDFPQVHCTPLYWRNTLMTGVTPGLVP
jgi:hypothetical protein